MTESELDRARAAYRARDAAGSTPYRWDNPGYVTYMQSAERALLRALGAADVQLPGARVLDVGCGTGYYLNRLRDYGAADCHGIDLLQERVTAARERYPSLHVQVGNAAELPYADGEFDLVTQFTCLSSILDDDIRLAAGREMRRVAGNGWVLSFDLRKEGRSGVTPTVALDEPELRRLFGQPTLLRRSSLRFDLAQAVGEHAVVAAALSSIPALRAHLLGLWRQSER